ncbi:MAG: glycosyltransferase [Candidatus Altiarchaeia archaeon]
MNEPSNNTLQMANYPLVSVIVPVYNEEKRISAALEALLNQTYPKEKTEIIVVDDGSKDRTCEVVTKYPVRLIKHEINKGDSASRNTGAQNARGEIIFTTDSDDKVDKNWISSIVQHYSHPNVAAVVGSSHIVFKEDNWEQRIIAELFIVMRGSDYVRSVHDKKGRFGNNKSIGSNQSFRKKVFFEVGGFDTGLTAGMEQDIIWRIERKGYSIEFEPDAIVHITPRETFKKYIQQGYSRGRSGIVVYFKHPQKINISYSFISLFFPIITIMSFLGILFNNLGLFLLTGTFMSLPFLFYLTKLIKGRGYIKRISDIPFILALGYLNFLSSSVGILRGFLDIHYYREEILGVK